MDYFINNIENLSSIDDLIIIKYSKFGLIEIKNSIRSHVYDGAALTKFIFWLKNNFKKKI